MLHYDLPEEVYRAHPALGSTDLKTLLVSPAHFVASRTTPPKKSEALERGSAVHKYLLEPNRFHSVYAVEPDGLLHKGKNPWKKDWEAFKEANQGKIILERSTWETVKGIHESVGNHPWARRLIMSGEKEVSALQAACKARADVLTPQFIADVKTCASIPDFKWSVERYQYYLQAAYYVDVFTAETEVPYKFLWIACETEPPYAVKVFICSDELLELGRKEYRHALELHQRCVDSGAWPCYDTDIEEIAKRSSFNGVLK